VLGAGVGGLQAIATAKRLGAVVMASDVRPAVKEQVESLGAAFIDVPMDESMEDKKGYATGVTKEFLARQQEEVTKRLQQADVAITTALISGKKAPILITEEMVDLMKPGSVIVDMAASHGGNCALTVPGKTTDVHGVKIIGETNILSLLAENASSMYAKNIFSFASGLITDGKLTIPDDEVYKDTLVVFEGKVNT
jgi:NAD(P) transhydrogenase subunit alpha